MAWRADEPIEVVPGAMIEQQLAYLAGAVSRGTHDSFDYCCRCPKCVEDRAKRIRARAAVLERVR